jgi:hypothetical protein
MREIFSLIDPTSDVNGVIVQGFANVIYRLVRLWNEDQVKLWYYTVSKHFDTILEKLKCMLNREIADGEDEMIHKIAAEALNHLIMRADDKLIGRLLVLYDQRVEDLRRSLDMFDSDVVRFVIQANLCSNLECLVMRLGGAIPLDRINHLAKLLYGILNRRDSLVYDEAMVCLANVFKTFYNLFDRSDINCILNVVERALDSQLTNLINAALVLLGDIFENVEVDISDTFEKFFLILYELITKQDVREIRPFIIICISKMFIGMSKSQENFLAGAQNRFFELLKLLQTSECGFRSDADIEYISGLYEGLCMGWSCFARIFWPVIGGETGAVVQRKEKDLLQIMANLASRIESLGRPRNSLLSEFVEMASVFTEKCERKNNLTLNLKANHNVLEMASSCPKLKKKALETIKLMKTK